MRRLSVIAVGSLLALAALAGTALAKEGAVSKLDQLPPGGLHAGQNITVGWTILMDGVEPYKADTTEIVIRNGTGKVLSYPGTPDGPENTKGRPKVLPSPRAPFPFPPDPPDGRRNKSVSVLCGWPRARQHRD